jgi:hypothetical protein
LALLRLFLHFLPWLPFELNVEMKKYWYW